MPTQKMSKKKQSHKCPSIPAEAGTHGWRKNVSNVPTLSILFPLFSFLFPLSSFAAINASQTLILQTGATERARLNTNGLETHRISTTYISATYIQIPNPTANNQPATKQYVDTAVAASSCSSRPKYMGATSTSYKGDLGGGTPSGVQRGHAPCHAQYPGSRMMLSEDIARTDFTTPIAVTGWVHCTSFNGNSCNGFLGVNLSSYGNCNYGASPRADWSASTWSDVYGMTFSSAHGASSAACNTSLPIHCVKD